MVMRLLLLLGNCFWREGLEGAFGPERREEKGGGGRGGTGLKIPTAGLGKKSVELFRLGD
jgi:hypothetical protein